MLVMAKLRRMNFRKSSKGGGGLFVIICKSVKCQVCKSSASIRTNFGAIGLFDKTLPSPIDCPPRRRCWSETFFEIHQVSGPLHQISFENQSIRPKMNLSSSIRTNFSPLDGGPLALTFAHWVHLLLRTSEQLSERKSAQHRVSHNLTTHLRPNLHIRPFNPSSISWVERWNRGWLPTVGQYIAETSVLVVE